MKRIRILALGLILAMSLGTAAWAAETSQSITNLEGDQTVSIGVTGSYHAGGTTREVYSVDVSWGAMNFTYSEGSSTTWDPATHEYKMMTGDEGGWASDGDTVIVTNHSSLPVNVKFDFAYNEENKDESGGYTYTESFTFDKNADEATGLHQLESAVNKAVDEADAVTATLGFTGTLTDTTKNGLGTVTVTISEVN